MQTPVIGYVTFPANGGTPEAQFNPITQRISVFNNPVVLAIEQTDPTVTTYVSMGPTGSSIAAPGTNTGTALVFTETDAGTLPDQTNQYALQYSIIPALTIETISEATGRPAQRRCQRRN